MANTIYASYNGSQLGFTVRNMDLDQLSFFQTGFDINDIAAGGNDDVYLAAANHLYHYKADGTLITDMTFPIDTINYTSVSVNGDRVYASYNGSQQGFTVRDLALNQLSYVQTGFDINSIAAGGNNDVFLASGNHIYHYNENGTLIKDMAFPIATINYTGVSVLGSTVYASYNGSQQGFTIRDMELNQLSYFQTGTDINSIAAGPSNDVFLASANHLYHFAADGTLIKDMNFPVSSINYTGVTGSYNVLT